MNYIFGGIDGTGTANDAQYKEEFKDSFVRQLWRAGGPWLKSYYVRGPKIDGRDTFTKLRVLQKSLEPHLKDIKQGKSRLILAGYSRGGAAVTRLCSELPVDIYGLLLFDAVDMTTTLEADVVPENVKTCFHAIRNPASFSRHTWGNCALRAADRKATVYIGPRQFLCTHGGMGGVPWPKPKNVPDTAIIDESYYDRNSTVARTTRFIPQVAPIQGIYEAGAYTKTSYRQDQAGSAQVRIWMWGNLRTLLNQEKAAA